MTMKRVSLVALSLLIVIALTISACSAVLPGSVASVGGYLANQMRAAHVAAAPTPTPVTAALSGNMASIYALQEALQTVYQAVNPSVVNIRVIYRLTRSGESLPSIPGFPSLPDEPTTPEVPPIAQSLGSGFVWDSQGHIVTNNHVVEGADEIKVTFYDGLTLPAELVGRDPDSDLAVIKVDPSGLDLRPVAVGDSTQVKVGQFVVAIGNPFGLQGTMTFGIVSALGRALPAGNETTAPDAPVYSIPDLIQTDAPVNPGNSGGVLLDLNGYLIGVPFAIESPVRASSGVGFAIPSALVQRVVPSLIETGHFEHPWIGISGMTLTSEVAKTMRLPENQRGALVIDVTKGSPADKAGLRGSSRQVVIEGQNVRVGGDVIIAIDDQPVRRFEDLTTYLARYAQVGQKVTLKVLRDGQETTVSLTLAARPTTQAPGPSTTVTGGAWLGIAGVTLTPELAEAMDLPADQKGVLIERVTSESPADQAGLRGSYKAVIIGGQRVMVGGDVIVAVDDTPVETVEALAKTIRAMKPGDRVNLKILRDGEELTVTVTLAAQPTTTP